MSSVCTQAVKDTFRQTNFFHGPTQLFARSIADRIDQQFNGTISSAELADLLRNTLAQYETRTDAADDLCGLSEIHYNQIRSEFVSFANMIGYARQDPKHAAEYAGFAQELKSRLGCPVTQPNQYTNYEVDLRGLKDGK